MKINGYDMDMYLKGIEDTEKVEDRFFVKKPSVSKRHIKNMKRVVSAIEDINNDTTNSLYSDIRLRWSDCMDRPMVYYRGNVKTAEEVFGEVDRLAMAFDEMGLAYGDQIVACMSNVPEVLTFLLAASKCGLIINFVSDKFSKNYIRKVFKQTPGRKLFVATDDRYSKIADLVDEACFQDKVIVSLTNSLKDGIDPYDKIDSQICKFVDRVPMLKKRERFIMSYSDLLDISKKWEGFDNGYARRDFYPASDAINAPLTITYVIDDEGNIKQIVHSNKSYVSMARFNDSDLSQVPKMTDVVSLSYVPTHLNTNNINIVNALSQKGAVAFEPVYYSKFLLSSMAINRPTNVYATRSVLVETAKQMAKNPAVAEYGFGNAIVVSAIDELPSKNEEAFINEALKAASAGNEVLPAIVGKTVLSVTGGTLEQGNIFFTLFKEKHDSKTSRGDFGLVPFQLANIAVLDEGGAECDYEEYGRLVLRSSNTTMLGYLTEQDNKKFKLMDNDGCVWTDTKYWGAILKNGNVMIKGNYDDVIELSNGQKVPYFMISDKLAESIGLLSCEVVKPDNCDDMLVAHVEFNPDETKACSEWLEMLLGGVEKKCQEAFSPELSEKIVYKIRPLNKPYPLTSDGKRNIAALKAEGIEDCYKPDVTGCEVEMIPVAISPDVESEKVIQKVKS